MGIFWSFRRPSFRLKSQNRVKSAEGADPSYDDEYPATLKDETHRKGGYLGAQTRRDSCLVFWVELCAKFSAQKGVAFFQL